MESVSFTYSQKGHRLLSIDGFLYQLNKTYTSKTGGRNTLYWLCERRRDLHCYVGATTDVDGNVIRKPTATHVHDPSDGRTQGMLVRHTMMEESARRPEAAPSALLNQHVTPDVVLNLPSETALKQAICRRRREVRPTDPDTAADLEINGPWTKTLSGCDWFLGKANVGEDNCFIFATEANLRKLSVSLHCY